MAFIETALGNLGLINGQNGNDGYTAAQGAQMPLTIAAFDQVEADLAGIFVTAAGNGASLGITGDLALLHTASDRLEAVTTAEDMLFGGDANWLNTNQVATLQQWMTAFFTDVQASSDGTINSAGMTQLLATPLPSSLSVNEATEFLNRWNLTVQYWGEGIYMAGQVPAGQSTDFIDLCALQTAFNTAYTAEQESQVAGYCGVGDYVQAILTEVETDLTGQGVCATVKLQIDQTATLSRSAFTGTLSITNSEGTGAMTNVAMHVTITDSLGNPANGEFFISSPNYSGSFSVVNGNATLPDNSTGTISFTFIPDDSAALSAPMIYDIGGTIGFTDPSGGAVSIPVFPATITVYPQAQLQINYFLQQTVIGEDPFNPQENIPSEPAVLGMLVTNVGAGTANGLSITTAQPTIIDNAKGLDVNIQIIGTQVGTQQETPSLNINFGNVAPGQTADADFLLLSSLQGSFTDFTATFTHSDALGGSETSLISGIQTHTLIHAGDFNYSGSTGEMDYLAEDNTNINNLPDTIYFSNGTTAPVGIATDINSSPTSQANVYTVTADVANGWDYIQLPDPGAGYTLSEVVRSDGTIIPVSDQAWTTDRTISDTGKSEVDYLLHILDYNSTGSYTVYYIPTPTVSPSSSVTALPAFSQGTFTVSWSDQGNTDPSGIASYSIYVSDNGGPFTPWLIGTTQTSSTFTGQNGHIYGFYSIATDNADTTQATPLAGQATTTVDTFPPSSSVAALQLFSQGIFTVSWSSQGNSDPAGIATYDIYVSDDGGAFTLWLANTQQTSSTYTGLNGHTYGFYSVATDNAGNVEATPAAAEAMTTVDTIPPTSTVSALPAITNTTTFTLTWSGSDNAGGSGLAYFDIFESVNGGTYTALLTATTLTSTTFTGLPGDTYSFYSVATDNAGNRQATPVAAQATTLIQAISTELLTTDHPQGSAYGQNITFTVTLSASLSAAGMPTGSVQFLVDGVNFGSPVILSNGEATISTSTLSAGSHIITGIYTSNSSSFSNATASPITQVVNQTATATILTSSLNPTPFGQLLTLTATVSAVSPGGGVSTGSVNFVDNGVVIATVLLPENGIAIYTTTALPLGAESLTAVYSGDANNLPSTSQVLSEQVTKDGTMVVVDSLLNPTVYGHVITFTATVSSTDVPAGIPSGTITFYDGMAPLGTGSLVNGFATFSTSALEVGTHTITALYSGDTDFFASSSPAIYETVQPAPSPISSVVNNNGEQQRSMLTSITVTFTGVVSPSALASAFTLTRMGLPNGEAGDDAAPGAINVAISTNASGNTVATLTFSGANTESGSLADGNWTLTIAASQITAGGIPMSSDYVQPDIKRLFGDINGTGTVDSSDLGIFGTTFGLTSTSPAFIAGFDSDGNGIIDSTDLGAFGTRFGLTI